MLKVGCKHSNLIRAAGGYLLLQVPLRFRQERDRAVGIVDMLCDGASLRDIDHGVAKDRERENVVAQLGYRVSVFFKLYILVV